MREPDKTGHVGWSAWLVPTQPPALAVWLLDCPGAHVMWRYWRVSLVHLRPLDGLPPAIKQYPDAEYELVSAALDPDREVNPDQLGSLVPLDPLDFVHHFHGMNDAQAVKLLELLVDAVIRGVLSPDSDWRTRWRRLIWGSVDHVTGGHPQGSA